MTPWAYDWTMFVMGMGALALVVWFAPKRIKAYQQWRGLRLVDLGIFGAAAGYLVGLSSLVQDLGTAPWWVIASGFFLGVALAPLASRRQTAKWESELQRKGELPARVQKWWQSWRFQFVFIAFGLVVAFFLSNLISSFLGELGGLVPTTSYVLSGFFVAFGHHVGFWAKQKEREGFRPLVIPIKRNKRR